MALALDATSLGDCFVVLVISVLYRGTGIPVAWVILPAQAPADWQPHWEALLKLLAPHIPADWCVVVAADRGLYAKWLFVALTTQGWHPFLRIKTAGTFRPDTGHNFRRLAKLVRREGASWCGTGLCFKSNPLACTLLAHWEVGYKEPWLELTDLAPSAAHLCWYGLRAWCEAGFRDLKRDGWQWHASKITKPDRAERVWLVMALATLWVLAVGGAADLSPKVSGLEELPATQVARCVQPARRSRPSACGCFRRGLCLILVALVRGEPLPLGRFHPLPWPTSFPSPSLQPHPLKNLHP